MTQLIENVKLLMERQIVENWLMEMANFPPKDTGLPTFIWLGEVGGQHGPRIKVSNIKGKMTSDAFVVSVSKTPKVLTPRTCSMKQSDLNDVMDWIVLNYDTLMTIFRINDKGEDGSVFDEYGKLKKLYPSS